MKLSLVVVSGPAKDRLIPILLSPFMIGRDPVCQLRPASAAVSNRHCTIWQRGDVAVIHEEHQGHYCEWGAGRQKAGAS